MKTAVRTAGGQVATTSRLYAWWMVTFRRYEVCGKTLKPQEGLLKRVRYVTTWFLKNGD